MPTLPHLASLARSAVPPMHPGGRPFVFGAAAATLLAGRVWPPAAALGTVATACCAWFFREPRRVPPDTPGVIVSAADGIISRVDQASTPPELGLEAAEQPRISVFLSIFDVHVQRAPVAAEVRQVLHRAGEFGTADLPEASDRNERTSMLLRTPAGQRIVVVQIAGLIARRIVCEAEPGQSLHLGQTYGLIRFGSRVDMYLPPGSQVLAREGQRTIGGETVLAYLPEGAG